MNSEWKDSIFDEALKVGVGSIMKYMSNFKTLEDFNILHFPNTYQAVSDIDYTSVCNVHSFQTLHCICFTE